MPRMKEFSEKVALEQAMAISLWYLSALWKAVLPTTHVWMDTCCILMKTSEEMRQEPVRLMAHGQVIHWSVSVSVLQRYQTCILRGLV